MRDRVALALRISSGSLVLCGYGALVSVLTYTPLLMAIPVLALGLQLFGERMDARYSSYKVITNALTIAFGCFLPLLFIVFGLLNAVIALVIFIQVYVLLHQKQERNYYHLILMSFFLLLAACVQSPEPVIGVVMSVYIVAAVWCFVSLRLFFDSRAPHLKGPAAEASARRSQQIELVPLHARATGQPPKTLFDAGLIAVIFALSLAAIVLTAGIFVATPRIEAGVFGRGDALMARTGISEEVDLTGGRFIQEDFTAMMRVSFPDGNAPDPADMYWRITTLSAFYQDLWSGTGTDDHYEPDVGKFYGGRLETMMSASLHNVSRTERPGAIAVRQSVFMDNVPEQGLPVLDLVQEVHVPQASRGVRIAWDRSNDFTVTLTRKGQRQLQYEAVSELGEPPADVLVADANDYGFMDEDDLRILTYHELLPATIELRDEVIGDADTVYEQARAIESWLSSPLFLYTLDVPPLPPDHAIDEFLATVRRGHCEIYASAMALLMRSLGIPSRVVVGYRGGEWNDSEEAFIVRANMAHLWVEVLFPDHGWVKFDPSPRSIDDFMGGGNSFAQALSVFVLRAKMFWYQEVVGFDRGLTLDRLRNLTLGWFGGESEDLATETTAPSNATRDIVPFATAAGLVLLAGLAWWLRPRHKAKQALTADQARAVKLYRTLLHDLQRQGVPVAGKTAEELERSLPEALSMERSVVAEIIRIYNESRFGMRELHPQKYGELRRALRRRVPAQASSR